MSATVTAEFARRAQVVTADTSGMALSTGLIAECVDAMTWRRAAVFALRAAERPTGRAGTRHDWALDEAESRYHFCSMAVEQAVRMANPNATEAQIMAAAQSF